MKPILALWATPRSTSTAFEWVMSHRGDMTCFHEPYNEAYYYGSDRRNDRYFMADADLKVKEGLTIRSVHEKLLKLSEAESVFIKDFAYSISHISDDNFLNAFTHSFLIREPEKVITSMHSRWPDISLDEIGFDDLHTLFNRIADKTGTTPVVIDSDELLSTPEAGMKAYCKSVGIPFIEEALSWEDRADSNKERNATWNSDEHGFHDSLKASTGLEPQIRNYPELSSSDDMLRLYDACLPHYLALKQHTLDLSQDQ
jgi:hypothetical protein